MHRIIVSGTLERRSYRNVFVAPSAEVAIQWCDDFNRLNPYGNDLAAQYEYINPNFMPVEEYIQALKYWVCKRNPLHPEHVSG